MNITRIVFAISALGFAIVISGAHVECQAQTPNIVFIMADDLGWSDTSNTLTNMGNPSDFYETPFLEQLAAQGMSFTNAYANQNCAPTRTAILSGAYAPRSTNNVYQVDDLNRGGNGTLLVGPTQGTASSGGGNDYLPNSTVTHAETLQTAGYTTAYIGKFHVTPSSGDITSDHGFDFNFGGSSAGGPGAYHASGGVFAGGVGPELDPYATNYTQSYVDQNIKPYSNGASTAAIDALVGTPKHVTDASVDAFKDFVLNETGTDPFFVQYSTFAVHGPTGDTHARDDLLDKYNNKTPGVEDTNDSYGALIEGWDQSVHRLVDFLETTPDPRSSDPNAVLADNTLVVVYSDNGGRQSRANNGPLKNQKGELDEGGVRVPMVAWSANSSLVDGGTINDTPVMAIDFYKTFASLAGASLPVGQTLDGEDISGIIADNTANLGRDNVFWHLPGYLVDDRNQRPQSVIRSGDNKLMYNYEDQSWELYDLGTDISESTNLAASDPNTVTALADELITWLVDVDAPLATLRSGTTSLEISGTGRSYANGVVTEHTSDTFVINQGEELPLLLGSFTVTQVAPPVDPSQATFNFGPNTETDANFIFADGQASGTVAETVNGITLSVTGGTDLFGAVDYVYGVVGDSLGIRSLDGGGTDAPEPHTSGNGNQQGRIYGGPEGDETITFQFDADVTLDSINVTSRNSVGNETFYITEEGEVTALFSFADDGNDNNQIPVGITLEAGVNYIFSVTGSSTGGVNIDDLTVTLIATDGDFDSNGIVDGRDFLAWQRGESPDPFSASDLEAWQTNYGGSSVGLNATSVPEPTSCVLALSALCLMMRRRRSV